MCKNWTLVFVLVCSYGVWDALVAQIPKADGQPSGQLSGQPTTRDEGVLSDLTAQPSPFSPACSPREKDTCDVGFTVSREMPIYLHFTATSRAASQPATGPDLAVNPPAIQRSYGRGTSRYEWKGQGEDGRSLPDGQYVIEAFTSVQFNWRYGDPKQRPPGVVHLPHAIAVEPASRQLYLAGSEFRIDVFAPDGTYVRSAPIKQDGKNDISGWIRALAFAPDGKLLMLLDRAVAAVNVADGAATVVVKLADVLGRARIDWLDGLAVDSKGRIYVGCAAAGKVFVFDRNGKSAGTVGDAGQDGGFAMLGDLAIGPEDKLYVTDFPKGDQPGKMGGRIQVFDARGKLVQSIRTTYGGGPIPMLNPRQLAVLSDGSIVVAEGAGGPLAPVGGMKMFAALDRKGALVASWGQRGSGVGEVCFVSRMTACGDAVYVSDHYSNHRVVRLDKAGKQEQVYQTGLGTILRPTDIVKLASGSYVVADSDLARCTVFSPEGKPAAWWSYWAAFGQIALDGPVNLLADGEKVHMLHVDQVVTFDAEGRKLAGVKLDSPVACTTRAPGLYIADDGRMLATGSMSDVPAGSGTGDIGKLLVFDAAGKKLYAISAGEGATLFGPVRRYAGKIGQSVWVQVTRRESGKLQLGLCQINIPARGEPTLTRTVWFSTAGGTHAWPDGPLAIDGKEFLKGGPGLTCFDNDGKMRWTLGSMQDKPYSAAVMVLDGNSIVTVNGDTGHLESWNLHAWNSLGKAAAEIDNTPPTVALVGNDAMVTAGDAELSVRGTAWDRNFDHYVVYWRPRADDPAKPYPWRETRREPYVQAVLNDTLAKWVVDASNRDRGIEVRVVAWDTAGNSSESQPCSLVFDDDGDGMSNPLELTLGTDPRTTTEYAPADAIRIQPDVALLTRPYFFNNYEFELRFTAYDCRDANNPKPLDRAKLTFFADAGTFAGGKVTGPPTTAPDTPTTAPAEWNAVSTTTGRAKWTSPNVDQRFVLIHVEFPKQGLGNVLYQPASGEVQLDVRRDDDRDWAVDVNEVAADSPDKTTSLKGNPDSDGDGVLDGLDLAPRTAFNDDQHWSSIYEPGMIRYTQSMIFYGMGGGDSHVTKYGDKIKGKAILRSDRVDSQDKVKEYLNNTLFLRDNKDARKRKPMAVVDWMGFTVLLPKDEEFISEMTYGGAGHPDYTFTYYARQAVGTPIIENIERIDGRLYKDAGIHRNYLRTSAPGMLDEFDRTVVVQWKVVGRDWTGADEKTTGFTRMGWLVEVLDRPDLKGAGLQFSGFAVAQEIGQRIYQASIVVPSENLYRNVPLYLKLTPCWFTRNGREKACSYCKNRSAREDVCPICGANMNRYGYGGVNREDLSVSAVIVETPAELTRWTQRLKPRPGVGRLEPAAMDRLSEASAQALINEGKTWPLTNNALIRNVALDGKQYSVLSCSARAMNQLPTKMSKEQKEARIAELTTFASDRLAGVDVVCLIANDQRKMADLIGRIRWGDDGTWVEITDGLKSGAAGNPTTQPTAGGATPTSQPEPGGKVDPSTLTKTLEYGKGLFDIGKESYSVYKHIAKWDQAQKIRSFTPGDAPEKIVELAGQSKIDPVTGLKLTATRSITVQKCLDGGYRVESRATVSRPWTVWKDPDTGITVIDHDTPQEFILHRTEKVADPQDSKIIEQGCEVAGTSKSDRKLLLARITPAIKIGVIVAMDGYKIYLCINKGDYVGVAVYSLKGTAEILQVVAEVKKVDSVLVDGLRVTGAAGAKINVVAAATGVMEAMYFMYQADKAPNAIEASLCYEKGLGCVIDAGIGAFEPYGGLVLAAWSVGGLLGNALSDAIGLGNNEIANQVATSPGQALIFLPLHWLPESVPAAIAKNGARDAQKEAVKKIDAYNSYWNRKYTYVWVPPQE